MKINYKTALKLKLGGGYASLAVSLFINFMFFTPFLWRGAGGEVMAQSGQKFATNGNSLSSGDFLGSTNNLPLIIKVNNLQKASFHNSGLDVNGNLRTTQHAFVDSTLNAWAANVSTTLNVGKLSIFDGQKETNIISSTGNIFFGTNNIQTKGDGSFYTISSFSLNTTKILLDGTPLLPSPWQNNGNDIYYNKGKVGIGTDTPTETFEVSGRMMVSGAAPAPPGTPPPTIKRSIIIDGGIDRITATSGILDFDTTHLQTKGNISSFINYSQQSYSNELDVKSKAQFGKLYVNSTSEFGDNAVFKSSLSTQKVNAQAYLLNDTLIDLKAMETGLGNLSNDVKAQQSAIDTLQQTAITHQSMLGQQQNNINSLQIFSANQQTEISNLQTDVNNHQLTLDSFRLIGATIIDTLTLHSFKITGLENTTQNIYTAVNNLPNIIALVQGKVDSLVPSQWKNTGNDIYYSDGRVGIGTSTPTEPLEVKGNTRISGNLNAKSITTTQLTITDSLTVNEQVDARRFRAAESMQTDTLYASKTMYVNHNLQLGNDSSGTGSDIASLYEPLSIQSGTKSAYDVTMSADNASRVGIGTRYPTEKLTVDGSTLITGNATINGDALIKGCLNINCLNVQQSSFADLNVTNRLKVGTSSLIIEQLNPQQTGPENHIFTSAGSGNLYINNAPASSNPQQDADVIISANSLQEHGHVGIGTNNPQKKLHVKTNHTTPVQQGTHSGIRIEDNLTGIIQGLNASVWDFSPRYSTNNSRFSIETPSNSNIFNILDNGNVGIGTINPKQKLHIEGNSYFDGNIGMGTDNPQQKLHVKGSVLIDGAIGVGLLLPQSKFNIDVNQGSERAFSISQGSFENFMIKGDGSVYARDVLVYESGVLFPDYVFEENYCRLNLNELEDYINKNKHLPGIPSAESIKKEGSISMVTIGYKSIEKIEELSLYIIEINKRLIKLEEENIDLRQQVRKLNNQ